MLFIEFRILSTLQTPHSKRAAQRQIAANFHSAAMHCGVRAQKYMQGNGKIEKGYQRALHNGGSIRGRLTHLGFTLASGPWSDAPSEPVGLQHSETVSSSARWTSSMADTAHLEFVSTPCSMTSSLSRWNILLIISRGFFAAAVRRPDDGTALRERGGPPSAVEVTDGVATPIE